MRKTIFSMSAILLACVVLTTTLVSVNASGGSNISATITKELDLINSNKLLTDEQRISKVIDAYFILKNETLKDIYVDDAFLFDTSSLSSKKNYQYNKNKIDYFKQLRSKSGLKVIWSNFNILMDNIKVNENEAVAQVTEENKSIVGKYENGFSTESTKYTIKMKKAGDKWLISEIASNDEFDKSYLDDETAFSNILNGKIKAAPASQGTRKDQPIQTKSGVSPQATYYNRTNAMIYAMTYANTGSYNSKFANYASANTDCQNFASQCVWYGFGGTNTTDAINNKSFPMRGNTLSSDQWYQTGTYGDCSTNGDQSPHTWNYVPHFANYIDTSSKGPWGFIYSGVSNADQGDTIQYWNGSEWSHTYVVVSVQGSSGSRTVNDIWVSAHTADINNQVLSSRVSNPSLLRTIRILGYVE